MEKISFLASLTKNQNIELSFCTELPETIHMVKIYHEEAIELFFDGEADWTSVSEEEAERLLEANLVYS